MDINIKQISENEYYNSKAYDIVYNGVGETYAKNIIPTDISESILLVAKLDKEIIGFVCGYNSSEYTDMININENINSTLKMIAVEPEY
jgi:CobQ-like glutamine amidotransferase family enzyme